jgi:hypothetical protein
VFGLLDFITFKISKFQFDRLIIGFIFNSFLSDYLFKFSFMLSFRYLKKLEVDYDC